MPLPWYFGAPEFRNASTARAMTVALAAVIAATQATSAGVGGGDGVAGCGWVVTPRMVTHRAGRGPERAEPRRDTRVAVGGGAVAGGRLARALRVRHRDRGAGRKAGAGRLALREDSGVIVPVGRIERTGEPGRGPGAARRQDCLANQPGTSDRRGWASASARASASVGAWGVASAWAWVPGSSGAGPAAAVGSAPGLRVSGGSSVAVGIGTSLAPGDAGESVPSVDGVASAVGKPLANPPPWLAPPDGDGDPPSVPAVSGKPPPIANARTATTTTRKATPNGARRSLPAADAPGRRRGPADATRPLRPRRRPHG